MNDTTNTVPEGFRPVDLDWSQVEPINWSVEPEAMGVVLGGKWAQYERRGQYVCSAIIKIQTAAGPRLLWESSQLTDFLLKLKIGDTILVRWKGKQKLPTGNELNTFEAYVKPADDRARRARALGERPMPKPVGPQPNLPGIPATPSSMDPPAEFDDDIPF